jgi:hypothetical protein
MVHHVGWLQPKLRPAPMIPESRIQTWPRSVNANLQTRRLAGTIVPHGGRRPVMVVRVEERRIESRRATRFVWP